MATSSARLDELKKKFDENPRRYFAPLANEYRKQGDLTQAIALCRAHLPNQPGHISGHIVLAQALYEARELGESRGIFEAALDLDPENLIALRYLGDIAREQGEPFQARGWYERVLDADPRNDEIAALLRALESESARPAEVVAAAAPSFGDVALDEPTDATSEGTAAFDFLDAEATPPAPEPSFPYAHTSDVSAAAETVDDDPFFGEAAAAPDMAVGDLAAAPEPSIDDWFAEPSAPAATSGADAFVTPSVGAEAIDDFASAVDSMAEPHAEIAAADGLEESFFPDLSGVTPPGSPIVPADPTPIDVHAVTPPFLTAQPEVSASIPTPAFLQAIEQEPVESADAEAPFSEFDLATDDAVTEVSASDEPTPFVPAAELPDAESQDAESPVAEVAAHDPEAPMDGFEPGEFLAHDAEPFASEPSDDLELEYGEFVAPASDEVPYIASNVSVPLDEPDAYSAGAPELSAHEPFRIEEDFRSDDYRSAAAAADDADRAEGADVADVEEIGNVAGVADDNDLAGVAGMGGADDAADVDAHGTPTPAWSAAAEDAVDFAPVDGLASREIAPEQEHDAETFEAPSFLSEPAAEAAALSGAATESTGTPFVTETMAELYLQQGFNDEALAIYRQLLAQRPDDTALAHRVAALERGAHSAVVDGVAPRDHADRVGQSVRSFFAHFARRTPRVGRAARSARERDDRAEEGEPAGARDVAVEAAAAVVVESGRSGSVSIAGVASREEALTVPDEVAPASAPPSGPAATLAELFQSGPVSSSDEHAASALAGAFGGDEREPAGRTGEGQLSLEHLFRDVPARSSGAVTLDEFYEGSSPKDASAADGSVTGESDADIEQFTAWLEGLKKK